MNTDGNNQPGYDYPGEEHVPDDFRAATLSPYLRTIRGALFSNDPDRLLMNYRLAQYMSLLHASNLEQDVLELDSRVTYWPADNNLFDHYKKPYSVKQISGSSKAFYVIGDVSSHSDRDRLYNEWIITVLDGSNVQVNRLSPPASAATVGYTVTNNLSSVLSLPGSPFSFRFESGVGSQWQVKILAVPKLSLGDVVNMLQIVDNDNVNTQLFGSPPSGRYAQYKQLWIEHDELAYKLSGLLLAVIYRTEELRVKDST